METSWRVIGASVRGTSHHKQGIPCQDASGWCVLANGVLLAAAADGAGSAERSDEGAQCAVETVMASVEAALSEGLPEGDAEWRALLVEAFSQARLAVEGLAEPEVPLRAFATTLACAVVADGWLAVGQIGDGIIVARGDSGELFVAVPPQSGEYANETYFLTMDEAIQLVEVCAYSQSVEACAVMTDGLIRLAMNLAENKPHLPFFGPLFAFTAQMTNGEEAQEQLINLLSSERVNERTDDDKTLILITRPSCVELETAPQQDTAAR